MELKTKTIGLPRLNRLKPTLESTALKLMEEAGELSAVIGKFRALSGENVEMDAKELAKSISQELLDVAQTAVTMMFVLEEQYNIDIESALAAHVDKLIAKDYLRL